MRIAAVFLSLCFLPLAWTISPAVAGPPYLTDDPDIMLEQQPIMSLAGEGQLHSYKHEGFWQPMDTYQETQYLNKLWAEGKAAWKIW